MLAQPGAVLVDPGAQAWPAADERLMRDIHGLAPADIPANGEQARVDEGLDDGVEIGVNHVRGIELAHRTAAARVFAAVARLGQAQQHAASELLLLRAEALVDEVGPAGQRARDTADA